MTAALHGCVRGGHYDGLEDLLAAGADPNVATGDPLLHRASLIGRTDLVKLCRTAWKKIPPNRWSGRSHLLDDNRLIIRLTDPSPAMPTSSPATASPAQRVPDQDFGPESEARFRLPQGLAARVRRLSESRALSPRRRRSRQAEAEKSVDPGASLASPRRSSAAALHGSDMHIVFVLDDSFSMWRHLNLCRRLLK